MPPSTARQDRRGSLLYNEEDTIYHDLLEAISLSYLIFIYADLRAMSSTGRIFTNFDTIAVDSDRVPRSESAPWLKEEYATPNRNKAKSDDDRGLSTTQVMAAILLEMRNHAQRNEEGDFDDDDGDGNPLTIGGALPGSSGEGSKQLEEKMTKLLRVYADIIGGDLKSKVGTVRARRSVLSLARTRSASPEPEVEPAKPPPPKKPLLKNVVQSSRFKLLVAKKKEEDAAAAAAAAQGPPQDTSNGNRNNRADASGRMSLFAAVEEIGKRNALLRSRGDSAKKQFTELTDAMFHIGESNVALQEGVAASAAPVVASGSDLSEAASQSAMTHLVSLRERDMVTIMERAVESRSYGALEFMKEYFEPGTISELIVQSDAKVVWFNDWYPEKECTYGIAVDESKRRVTVMFRGAITMQDWSHAIDSKVIKVHNPIKEDYPDKPDKVSIYSGFYSYLFRKRKDTGTTKFQEICTMAHKYGIERIGEDYCLMVCGHSLGAALTTVFSFHASADDRFTKNGPIKMITFGSPYIGSHDFADCFRHQEEIGKLRYARFYNHNDLFAHIPDNSLPTKRGSKYRHVGIGVKIKPVPSLFKSCRSWRPDVFYVPNESCGASYWRGLQNNALFHTTWVWKMSQMHTLQELMSRIMDGSNQPDAKEGFAEVNMSFDRLYEHHAGIKRR